MGTICAVSVSLFQIDFRTIPHCRFAEDFHEFCTGELVKFRVSSEVEIKGERGSKRSKTFVVGHTFKTWGSHPRVEG